MNAFCRFILTIFLITGVVYPLGVTALAQWLFPQQANGSLIMNEHQQPVGSWLIGQSFKQSYYFHPRPSLNAYDGGNSGGSNYGMTSKKLIDRVKVDVKSYRTENPDANIIPADAVTMSSSGLDPHISLANALNQVPRVAQARHMSSEALNKLVYQASEQWVFSVTPYVNVVKLNRALEQQK